MSMNSHIRSFIHQHNSSLGKAAADARGHPAGSQGGNAIKTHRKCPSEESSEKAEQSSQAKFECIKSKREGQTSRSGPRMFPLNQCTNFALHDTKHSVRVSVRFAVLDYKANSRLAWEEPENCNQTESYANYTIGQPLSIDMDAGVLDSDAEMATSPLETQPVNPYADKMSHVDLAMYDLGVGKSGEKVCGSCESLDSTPSISSLKPGSQSEHWIAIARFNEMVNKRMSIYLSEKFTQSHQNKTLTSLQKKAESSSIEEAVIFCTNLFLQEFKSSNPAVICEEYRELRECGELKELLHDMFQDLIEKMESSKFDQFQDFVIETITFNRSLQSTVNPDIYDKFLGIWALNVESFLEMDLEILLMYCDSGQERQFSYFTSAERFYNKLEEAAVRMNLVKFFYTYKWELMKKRRKKLDKQKILSDLDYMQDLLDDGIGKFSKGPESQMGQLSFHDRKMDPRDDESPRIEPDYTSSRKKKSLRFTDEVCVG